jgi:hypothetical protein
MLVLEISPWDVLSLLGFVYSFGGEWSGERS